MTVEVAFRASSNEVSSSEASSDMLVRKEETPLCIPGEYV